MSEDAKELIILLIGIPILIGTPVVASVLALKGHFWIGLTIFLIWLPLGLINIGDGLGG